MKNDRRKARGKGQGTLERKPNGIYLARWVVNGRKYSRSTGTTDKDKAEIILADFVKPFQSKSRIKRLENLIDELKNEQDNLGIEKENNKDKKTTKEIIMNDENDRRNYVLNKSFTIGSCLAASFILLYKHLYLLFAGHMAFSILFPIAYVFLEFSISDCINKPYIIDKGMNGNAVMMFRDERKNIRVSEFISRKLMNANFWIVIASTLMAYVGLSWK